MSKANNNNNKKFCKVCFDSKKPEAMFTSHCVKTRDGTVICPTLLSAECRFCHKTGHTVSKCPVAKKHDKMKASEKKIELEIKNMQSQEQKPTLPKNKNNAYAALIDDDEENDQCDETEEYPELVKSTATAPVSGMNFKKILMEAPVQVQVQVQVKPPVEAQQVPAKIPMMFNKSWADWSDSDSEDEAQEIVYNDAW